MFLKTLKLKHIKNFILKNENFKIFITCENGKIIYKTNSFNSLNLKLNSIYEFFNFNKNYWNYLLKKYSNEVFFLLDLMYEDKIYNCIVQKFSKKENIFIFNVYNISNVIRYTSKVLIENDDKYLADENLLINFQENEINELVKYAKSLVKTKSINISKEDKIFKANSYFVKFELHFFQNLIIIEIIELLKDAEYFNLIFENIKNSFILVYEVQVDQVKNFLNRTNLIENLFIESNITLKDYIKNMIKNELQDKDYFLLNEFKLKINEKDEFYNVEFIKKNNNNVLIIFNNVTRNILPKIKTLTIIDNIPLIIAKLDKNHRVTFVNDTYCDIFDKTKNEIINSKFLPIIHEEDKVSTLNNLKKLLLPPYETRFRNRILTAKGWKIIEWYYKKLMINGEEEIIIIGEDITEKSSYEDRLKKLEKTYNLIYNNSNYGIVLCDYHLQILDLNSFIENILKSDKEKLIGNVFTSIFNLNTEKLEIFLNNNNVKNLIIETNYLYSNGNKKLYFEITANKLSSNLIQFIIFDITEKFVHEQQIREEKEKYYELFNASIDAIFIMKEYKIIDCNLASEILFKMTKEQIIGKTPYELSPEYQPDGKKSIEKAKELIEQALNGFPQRFEWVHERSDETKFIADVSLQRFFFNNEIYIHAILRDITEEKKLREETFLKEKLISRSNKMLQLILNTIPIRVYWKDKNMKFAGCNKLFAKDIGFENEEDIIDKSIEELDINNLLPIFEEDKTVINKNIPIINEELSIENNGEIVFLRINKIPLVENNEIIGLLGTYEDITHIKMSEITLKETEEKFHNVFKYINDGIIIFNEEFCIIETNDKLLQITEYKFEEIKNLKFEYLFEFKQREKLKIWINDIIKSKNNIVEITMKSKTGKLIPVELNGNIIEINNKQKYFICIIRDITERKNFENEIINAILRTEEKEREKFSKNLHDELGPLLSSIKMYINSLNLAKEEEKQKFIIQQLNDLIKESIDTIKEIANDLSPHILSNYGLNSAIENFLKKIEKYIKISFNSNIGEKRFPNNIEISIYRIIKELINNTLKHGKANEIEISLTEKRKRLTLYYVDNGIGFDLKYLKEKLKQGMGISNIISRIKTLNGYYEIITEPQKGFKFIMEIPLNNNL